MFHLQSNKVLPPRIQCLAWRLHQYNFRIQRVSGKDNTADSLSRLPSKCDNYTDSGTVCENYVRFVYDTNMLDLQAVTFAEMSHETGRDDTLSKLTEHNYSKWQVGKFKPFKVIRDELFVYEGVVLRRNRIVVPSSLQKKILKLSHETHQGIVKTKQFLRSRFFWPGMDSAAEAMIQNCRACVLNQPLNKYTPLRPSSLPRGPWVKGEVDIVGPVNGIFILMYIDYYSSYPERHILQEITSREVIRVLTDIFATFGFPEELVSDNGKQFVSPEFENFLKTCGIKHTRVSPYFARSNGKLERFHRYLKKKFRAAILQGKSREKELPKILISYRATPHPVSGKPPTMLLFNRELGTKVPHVEPDQTSQTDDELCSWCHKYQERMKIYIATRKITQRRTTSKLAIPYFAQT